MSTVQAVRPEGRQDQQDPHLFFVVEAVYAGQGLSYRKYNVKLLMGQWPGSRLMRKILGGKLDGHYEWATLDTATYFVYTD